ncbi:MAG: Flp pilus assembly complex ATPase component TadA [Ectothiorhodospiraceae bacterium]|nr:Flp pilus assembly complex ATPase component TadA [Chromatiales bacterium]MCP5154962.1 Flp pilus assembly complex ATPase component TadA [Ectothiorhodospiraceae bacterium]
MSAAVARTRLATTTELLPPGPLAEDGPVTALAEMLEACLAAGESRIVVDLSNVSRIDGAALDLLARTHQRATRLGGGITLVRVRGAVQEVLELVDLHETLGASPHRTGGAASGERRRGPAPRLGELLVGHGLVTPEVLEEVSRRQQRTGRRLGQILVEEGLITEVDLLRVLAEQLGLQFAHLRSGLFDPAAVRLLPRETARRLGVVPLFRVLDTLHVATSDPQAIPALDAVEEMTGCRVRPVLAAGDAIRAAIDEAFGGGQDLGEYLGELDADGALEVVESRAEDYAAIDEMAAGSPVVNLVNGLIQRAVRDGASDIHIEPGRERCRVRFRIDGMLYPVTSPPMDVHPALVSRLKVMANLDIAERRLPQDGRIQVYTHGRTVDLRFSSLPGIFGEKVVLRVLDKSHGVMDLDHIGLRDGNLEQLRSLLRRSHGLILVTGPTGSGKTTTLYAAVNHLNSIDKSIVTIEDPVEYQLDLVNQNQVRDGVGLGFATMLKHVLRQDPDIIMVGEIRERQTAEIAVQAALTGHLVLSTLHTNDSVGAITRMIDMGVEPFLLSSALVAVMAQRLVRTICPDCRTTYVAPAEIAARQGLGDEAVRLARGRGCPSCYDSGYKGRLAIHEILECDADTQRLMVSNPSRDDLAAYVARRKMLTLRDDGLARVREGATTIEEVTRVVSA